MEQREEVRLAVAACGNQFTIASLSGAGLPASSMTRLVTPVAIGVGMSPLLMIVFQSDTNPVNDGLVDSLGRLGGNLTDASRLSTDLIPKRLGLTSELVPKMTAIVRKR